MVKGRALVPGRLWLIRPGSRRVVGVAVILLLAGASAARAQATSPTGAAPLTAPAATTADFAWLAGLWRGELASGDGTAEVVFTPPSSGIVTGVMHLVSGGKVVVVELISLVDTPRGPELRFRHFSPELTAYEADFRQTLRLKERSGDTAVFENAVPFEAGVMSTQPRTTRFVRAGADRFVAHSDILGQDGKPAVIEVVYRRVPGS